MTYEYGEHAPGPPSPEAIGMRDRLAEEMAAAPPGSSERWQARKLLVDHLRETEGMPLEDFSTRGGSAFVVRVSVSKPKPKPGRERDAKAWMARQEGSARTLAHKLIERGGGLPSDLFEPLNPSINVEPAQETEDRAARAPIRE